MSATRENGSRHPTIGSEAVGSCQNLFLATLAPPQFSKNIFGYKIQDKSSFCKSVRVVEMASSCGRKAKVPSSNLGQRIFLLFFRVTERRRPRIGRAGIRRAPPMAWITSVNAVCVIVGDGQALPMRDQLLAATLEFRVSQHCDDEVRGAKMDASNWIIGTS